MNHTITIAQLLWLLLAIANVVATGYVAHMVHRLGWRGAKLVGAAVFWPLTLLLFWIVSRFGNVQ